jgi:hypothetical protein
MHSTDAESTPPPPRVGMSIHPESTGKSCSDFSRVLVLNDPNSRTPTATLYSPAAPASCTLDDAQRPPRATGAALVLIFLFTIH